MNFASDKRMGQNIRTIREQQGITQEQLAARFQIENCDLTRSALAKIEVGQRHIYTDEIKLFHKILGMPYDALFA